MDTTQSGNNLSDLFVPKLSTSKNTDAIKYNVPTKNRFTIIDDSEEEIEANTNENVKKQNPPPIILHRKVADHKGFVDLLTKKLQTKFPYKIHSKQYKSIHRGQR